MIIALLIAVIVIIGGVFNLISKRYDDLRRIRTALGICQIVVGITIILNQLIRNLGSAP